MDRSQDAFIQSLGPEFCNAKCLNLCELSLILGDQLKLNPRRTPEAQNLIHSSFDYSCRFAKLKARGAICDVRANLERDGVLHEFEMASLVNLLPRTAEEAKSLLPSLSRLSSTKLSRILEQLETFRVYAG